MSNTVITNYTDLNGPSSKADSSVVVVVNKDGSLSVDKNLLGTLMGTDGAQTAGISVVRVGHEGRPDDATDSEEEDDKVPHVTLSVDSYYDEPNSIIKYDSGAEMLQSLRIETRENSLIGFQNDHCYTPLTSPSQGVPQKSDNYALYDEPVIEITHTPPPKPVPQSKKITILEQQIIPRGKKLLINPNEGAVILKGNDLLSKSLPILSKSKQATAERNSELLNENTESSSSVSSSGDSILDRDSDSDYKDTTDRSSSLKFKKTKSKPRILKSSQAARATKLDQKPSSRLKTNRNLLKRELKERLQQKNIHNIVEKKQHDLHVLSPKENLQSSSSNEQLGTDSNNDINKNNVKLLTAVNAETVKNVTKLTPKSVKKEKKTPAHMTALLSDMTSLFSTPDVIRRVSTDNKIPAKSEKELVLQPKKPSTPKVQELNDDKLIDNSKCEIIEKPKQIFQTKPVIKPLVKNVAEKVTKGFDLIPQLDDASLAQILQDTNTMSSSVVKPQTNITTTNPMNSPGLAGPLSPTLDLLGGLQPEEEGLTEDLLMHVAQLVESSENLQEVIDKQVLGKVDSVPAKVPLRSPFQQAQPSENLYTPPKTTKTIRKDPIEIVRRDGRVITLPPIEAPATRASKRKSQVESTSSADNLPPTITPAPVVPEVVTSPEPMQIMPKQYLSKKLSNKKQEQSVQAPVVDKVSAESQESWNSEDDPNRLWCICKQPHNNRFMICCDSCEDWFHGKCVNITKAMGQQMEEQGIEWRCPNCVKKTKGPTKPNSKILPQKKAVNEEVPTSPPPTRQQPTVSSKESSKTCCIVCKKAARASSIYCSDACILKHAQDSLGNQGTSKSDNEPGKHQDKQKSDSRVIVYERKTGRLLAGPNTPTAENLKTWLQKNPTFEVVRPGTLSTIKPNVLKKKTTEPNKIQTTLNFERIPRKSAEQVNPVKTHLMENKDKQMKLLPNTREDTKTVPQPKTPVTPKHQQSPFPDTPRPSTSTAKSEPRKLNRLSRSQSSYDKAPSVSPSTSRRKDSSDNRNKMHYTGEPIRENVRKALNEQMSIRMAVTAGSKFTEDEIHQFAIDTEAELHELFRDVGMKYKAKYRSLMFNIKDRKNHSLWQKICDRDITPKQLVRLSPEELASQELAQWRDKEAKHQLELIKKSELDLLAASKTYVLKTHKGEEVMETKESVSTELDPNVPVEDLVTALNDSTVGEEVTNEIVKELPSTSIKLSTTKKHSIRKKEKEEANSNKKSRESKRDSESRKSRSSRRRSDIDDRDGRSTRRSEKRSRRVRSACRDRSKPEAKDKSDSRHRSRSRAKSKRRSKSRERSGSVSNGHERSNSRDRSTRLSQSKEESNRRTRSRSKQSNSSTDEKIKLRSRSQEAVYTKSKNDSTDSDSVERPKSAMLKEVHPEYDPHEPMITSAFSEEDLRKSREDVYEDNYKEVEEFGGTDFEPSKSFAVDIDSNITLSPNKYKHDKISEAESDQEPSSTVEHSSATVWSGCINMVDVARFYVAAHEVSGSASDLEEDLTAELDIVGRINPDTVWDYIGKMKRASNKDIIILKLQAANDEEKMQYIALYSYLSGRNRLGVVKVSNTATVKDFYIVPVPANTNLPAVLMPLDGPGLGEVKTHLLIAIIIRQRKKRVAPHMPKDVIPAKVARESRKRSYTPPMATPRTYTPPTSPRRRALPVPAYTSPALSTSVKDKIAASLASAGDDEEAYSPGSSSSSSSVPAPQSASLRNKMEELNRQIEEQKQQILKMTQADSSVGEDEAYSPSRPMTPPAVVPLADIALPSNLHEILATIKQRENPPADVDMRTLPLS